MSLTSLKTFKLPKPLIRALIAFVGVLGFFTALIFIMNLSMFDQELDPEIAASLEFSPLPPPNQNAYVALWGMPAASGLDMIEIGQKIMALHDQNAQESPLQHAITDEELKQFYQREDLESPWLQEFQRCNPRAQPGCLSRMATAIPRLQDNAAAQLAIERYQQLISLPYFQEKIFDSFYDRLPSYNELLGASQLHLANLYFQQSPQFLAAMQADMNFWKMVLDSDNTLIAKMISVAAIWKNGRYLSEYMAATELSNDNIQLLRQIIQPLSRSELDISEVWRYERHPMMSAPSFDDPISFFIFDEAKRNRFTSFLSQALLQVNASKNLSYHGFWRPLEVASKMSPNELHSLLLATKLNGANPLDCCRTEQASPNQLFPMNFYNLTGKQSFDQEDWAPLDYIERVFDLQGMLHLVNLQLEILTSPDQPIADAIQHSKFVNPHTLQPMKYISSNKTLSFECQDRMGLCQITLQ